MAVVARFGLDTTTGERVPVACLVSDVVGDCMALRDVATGTGRWRVSRADPTVDAKMPALGVLVRKDTPTTGLMQRMGKVEGIYSGLNPLLPVWVGADGRPVQIAPAPLTGTVIVQRFGASVADGVLFLTGEIGPLTKRRA